MFGKDKNDKAGNLKAAPVSFSNMQSSVVPKQGKDNKSVKVTSTTLIAKDTDIFGDIKFSGNLDIEGSVIGNITANSGSDGTVRVLDQGRVEGDLHVPKAMINGYVKGNVHAISLELAAKAKIEGNVHYQGIEMIKGSQVNGSLLFAESPSATPSKK